MSSGNSTALAGPGLVRRCSQPGMTTVDLYGPLVAKAIPTILLTGHPDDHRAQRL